VYTLLEETFEVELKNRKKEENILGFCKND